MGFQYRSKRLRRRSRRVVGPAQSARAAVGLRLLPLCCSTEIVFRSMLWHRVRSQTLRNTLWSLRDAWARDRSRGASPEVRRGNRRWQGCGAWIARRLVFSVLVLPLHAALCRCTAPDARCLSTRVDARARLAHASECRPGSCRRPIRRPWACCIAWTWPPPGSSVAATATAGEQRGCMWPSQLINRRTICPPSTRSEQPA